MAERDDSTLELPHDADDDLPGTAPVTDEGIAPDDGADTATIEDEAEGPAPLAVLRGVEHHYGDHHALGPVDVTLDGTCIGLLGPNGAGKSTLLRILMGLLTPTHGEVELLGHSAGRGARQLRRRIGYVPEGQASFPGLSGVEAVAYAGQLVGMPAMDALQRAHQVMDYVGLGEARYRDVDTYSTGMRRRLQIAQGLVHDPEVLILDEPTEGVDPQAREEILQLVSELVRDHGLRLIISTHLLHDVERLATHVLILNQGRVVRHGTLEELRTRSDRGHQVRLLGDHVPLVGLLQERDIEHAWMPPDLRVRMDDPVDILKLAEEAGCVVRHLTPVEISLDEAFEEALSAPDVAASDDEAAIAPNWSGSNEDDDRDGAADDATTADATRTDGAEEDPKEVS